MTYSDDYPLFGRSYALRKDEFNAHLAGEKWQFEVQVSDLII